jgi:hypothetical protein
MEFKFVFLEIGVDPLADSLEEQRGELLEIPAPGLPLVGSSR